MSLKQILENKIPHKPIPFNTDMVRETLEDRKTLTRRTNGLDKIQNLVEDRSTVYEYKGIAEGLDNTHCIARIWKGHWVETFHVHCPFGKPGDLLWVREKWRVVGWPFDDGCDGFDIQYSDKQVQKGVQLFEDDSFEIDFVEKLCSEMDKRCEARVDEEEESFYWFIDEVHKHMPWKPSIHMPKAAARIWLRIKNIRVERLQDISDEDAKAEGIQFHFDDLFQEYRYRDYNKELQKQYGDHGHDYPTWREPVSSFASLWCSINGPDSFVSNPWVWVIEFEVLSTTGAPSLELIQPKSV